MENDDQTLEGSDSELSEELELEPENAYSKELGGDPLDDIQDEGARAEAKKNRAIARRLVKKPEAKVEVKTQPVVPSSSEFLTKADFHKANERKAIREAQADAEVKANWSEIAPFYTPRNGRETVEDIAEDIQDAITLFKSRNPVVETDDSKDQLTTTPIVKTGGGVTVKATSKTPNPPNFALPSPPTDWYPKKS